MNHPPYRAVIVDFDRTLLHTDKTISDHTVKVMRTWQEASARLFAATARPQRAITEYCRLISFDAVTTLNGARTVTPDAVLEKARTVTPDAVLENPISAPEAEAILEQLDRIPGAVISVEAGNGIYANTDIPLWMPTVVRDIRTLPQKEKIYKVLASHPQIPVEDLPLTLPEDTYCTVAEHKLLIDSGQAVYFGDDNDDIEPIRNCGCGVAVSNALDSVRGIADYITGSNDEDGVAAYLSELFC